LSSTWYSPASPTSRYLPRQPCWCGGAREAALRLCWRPWLAELTRDVSLVRYDERGNGMSDWDTPELSLDAFVDDLARVVDDAGLERFDLLGISQGAPVSIAYAVRHPERVRKIVLCGAYAAGWRARGDQQDIERREAMVTLTKLGWGSDNPAYRQLFTSLYIPGATPRQADWYNELQRRSTSPANAAALMEVLSRLDVRDLLGKVRAPTIVFHARDDQAVPFAQGELLWQRASRVRSSSPSTAATMCCWATSRRSACS
jgi:pimeloyl-ACP methyl ester carboxylesterase